MMNVSGRSGILLLIGLTAATAWAHRNKGVMPTGEAFDSLSAAWVTPTGVRAASGAPGPEYWQQQVDYTIDVTLDPSQHRMTGSAQITYTNNSPHTLRYLWLQMDQNAFARESASYRSVPFTSFDAEKERKGERQSLPTRTYRTLDARETFPGGYRLDHVRGADGAELPHRVVDTLMRVDLPEPLAPGAVTVLSVAWSNLITSDANPMRTGYRVLEKDGLPVYVIAQWYPRLCPYSDADGWQTKPYLSGGEFALEFGDFKVSVTAPADYVIGASGELVNADAVLTAAQRERLGEARAADRPVMIVTPDEAAANRSAARSTATKTWTFEAKRVRDFAFAASVAYIWDAMGVEIEGTRRLAMSLYPPEASAIWQTYSTEAVAATLEGYSKFVYPYPYPVAWSCWGPVGGMEYPMMSFQGGEVEEDGTYSLQQRNYVINVIVHEVGHNWFPMIINSDERAWMWLDEGLNSFVERLVSMQFDPKVWAGYNDGDARTMESLARAGDESMMTRADNLRERGFTSYSKPEVGLMILRESILGPEVFDTAMQEYARRWAFKRPIPEDFFRTMADASGVDLDWFWRGWFYGTDHVDRAISTVVSYKMDPSDLAKIKELDRADRAAQPKRPYDVYLDGIKTRSDLREWLQDIYYETDPFVITPKARKAHDKAIEKLETWEKELLDDPRYLHVIEITDIGGMPMPISLDLTFTNGETRHIPVPPQIWARGHESIRIPLLDERELASVEMDRGNPFRDVDLSNNRFPQEIRERRFYLKPSDKPDNLMQDMKPEEKKEGDEDADAGRASDA